MTAGSSEEQLLEFLYACPVGLVECDAAGEIGMMNPHAMQHLLPLAGARDPGNLFTALDQHAPELRNMVAAFVAPTGRICEGHRIFVDLGGGRRKAVPKVLACTLVKLSPNRLMVTLSDISQQIVQEQRLNQASTWFATLLDGINDYATMTITHDGDIVSTGAYFTSQTGHDSVGVIGRPVAAVLGEDESGGDLRWKDQLSVALRDGWHFQEGWQRRANADRYWCQCLIVAGADTKGLTLTGFSVVLRDVPRRAAPTDDLRRLLTCDHLTGAANRRHFGQVLERERTRWRDLRQPLSLIILDLDHFKAINDTHGHPTGDELLRSVSKACTSLLPPRGVFARLGGEEFGALLPRHDIDQAMLVAESLRQEIAGLEFVASGSMLKATASFGCATMDEVDGSIDALLALADKRLYAAKREGRNRVHRPRMLAA